GIMIYDERLMWTPHAPWTCLGAPLFITPLSKTPNQGRADILMDDKDKTLVEEQYNKRIIVLSGKLTSTRSVMFPLNDGSEWLVRNNTDGAHNIIVKGKSGDGISVLSGTVKT